MPSGGIQIPVGLRPLPIFINGVEAHTVVRDLLTTEFEQVGDPQPPPPLSCIPILRPPSILSPSIALPPPHHPSAAPSPVRPPLAFRHAARLPSPQAQRAAGLFTIDSLARDAVVVDAVVSTIGAQHLPRPAIRPRVSNPSPLPIGVSPIFGIYGALQSIPLPC